MRTTIDLPEPLINQVIKSSKKSTKKDAIIAALESFLKYQKKQKLIESAGQYPHMKDLDIRQLRRNRDLG